MTASADTSRARTDKKIGIFRSRLLGLAQADSRWYCAVEALEFSRQSHEGMRRADGCTPYILHPVEAAMYVLTLSPNLMFAAQTVAVTLLHDVVEDCSVRHAELEQLFGIEVADATLRISKVVEGVKKSEAVYFGELGGCPRASFAKLADRVNNQNTMGGVFSAAKQLKQVQETETFILPMAKAARRSFPRQELAYENAKLLLQSQIALIRALHEQPAAAA